MWPGECAVGLSMPRSRAGPTSASFRKSCNTRDHQADAHILSFIWLVVGFALPSKLEAQAPPAERCVCMSVQEPCLVHTVSPRSPASCFRQALIGRQGSAEVWQEGCASARARRMGRSDGEPSTRCAPSLRVLQRWGGVVSVGY